MQFVSYPSLMDDYESAKIINLLQETLCKKKKSSLHESLKIKEEEKHLEPVVRKIKSQTKIVSPQKYLMKEETEIKDEEVEEMKTQLKKPRKRGHAEEILEKVCVEVCKPEICCADEEEKRKAKLRARDISKEDESAFWKRKILKENKLLTDKFADEVEAAKRDVRAWRQRVMSGKRDFWSPRATEVVYEKPEKKREKPETAPTSRLCETRKRVDRIFGSLQKRARNGSSATAVTVRIRFRKCERKERRQSHISKSTSESQKRIHLMR